MLVYGVGRIHNKHGATLPAHNVVPFSGAPEQASLSEVLSQSYLDMSAEDLDPWARSVLRCYHYVESRSLGHALRRSNLKTSRVSTSSRLLSAA